MSDKPIDEQAEKAEEARHREILDRLERIRQEHSQEHGAIITRVDDQNKETRARVDDQNKATRAHIGNEVATVRGDGAHYKNFMERMLKAMKRFLERHGIGTDDL